MCASEVWFNPDAITKWGNAMSAVTHDVILENKRGKKRRKGVAALRKLRQALARKKLEEMRDDQLLQEQIYDVFADIDDTTGC